MTTLGDGSNILPADRGVKGLVAINEARRIAIARTGEVVAETGCRLQELFLKTAQAGLGGLEYAVGIPGTLGGALVSNAGAYRSSISEFLQEVEVFRDGRTEWVSPSILQFSYRDSLLRQNPESGITLLRARFILRPRTGAEIYAEARDYQRQRISKQPPQASAGSFFKNVNDAALAQSLADLPEGLKKAGVVPAGYLLESAGMKGCRMGAAGFGRKHANFLLNLGGARASELRALAEFGKDRVRAAHGVLLEEEVLYLGDWD